MFSLIMIVIKSYHLSVKDRCRSRPLFLIVVYKAKSMLHSILLDRIASQLLETTIPLKSFTLI